LRGKGQDGGHVHEDAPRAVGVALLERPAGVFPSSQSIHSLQDVKIALSRAMAWSATAPSITR
jgi:hypothetical protein